MVDLSPNLPRTNDIGLLVFRRSIVILLGANLRFSIMVLRRIAAYANQS